jgi:hypothetical protein
LAFENVSKLPNAMSDYLCRLATGGAVRLRALFKDSDETLLRATRPVMMEGITNFIVRPDLMDRAIILEPETLTDRQALRVLLAEFDRARPGLFGALLDHLVVGIQQLPDTRLDDLPRMADFALWATACGLADFPQAYASNCQRAVSTALEHDELARAIRALMTQRHTWAGTASELLDQLGGVSQIPNAKVLSDELTRIAPMLRSVGINVDRHRTDVRRGITITREAPRLFRSPTGMGKRFPVFPSLCRLLVAQRLARFGSASLLVALQRPHILDIFWIYAGDPK